MPTLRAMLDERVREADAALYETLENGRVRCFSCGHCCPIPEGQAGVCKVRYNRGGTLYVPWGYTAGMQCDPIEKKPFFHAYPGALAYSFGMLGCDLHCAYCQNWVTSQALRDPKALSPPFEISPEAMVRDAVDQGAKVLVSTYNEPLITSEWAVAVFKEARVAGLLTGFVSNGNGTPQVLEYIRPWIDLYKIDLKSFDDRHYHELGGRIGPILETIRRIHQMGLWLEIVTLLIPGFNDSEAELRRLTEFLAGVSPEIPWHVTAFHTDYKMQGEGQRDTSVEDLLRGVEIGREAGLRYIYAGNLPGSVGMWEDTRCAHCQETLIRRYGYFIEEYRLTPEGACPRCARSVPGRWARQFEGQITSHPFRPHKNSTSPLSRLFTITTR
jgi:pyruvate formate lyase activating enzyme